MPTYSTKSQGFRLIQSLLLMLVEVAPFPAKIRAAGQGNTQQRSKPCQKRGIFRRGVNPTICGIHPASTETLYRYR